MINAETIKSPDLHQTRHNGPDLLVIGLGYVGLPLAPRQSGLDSLWLASTLIRMP